MRKLQADQKQHGTKSEELCVVATGGGAFKYYDRITEVLGVEVRREDEMECLIEGRISQESRCEVEQTDMVLIQASISSSTRYPTRSSPTAKKSP